MSKSILLLATTLLLGGARPLPAQAPVPLAELTARARAVSPEIQAARRMADAAAARIPPAGALPDPVLSLGLMNVPLSSFSLREDELTMPFLQLTQMLPARGVRPAREAVARAAHRAAAWEAEEVEREVLTRLKAAYHELLFADGGLEVLARNRALLVGHADVARARYAVGAALQADVLRAQTEVSWLDGQISALELRRAAALADVNAVLGRSPDEPLAPELPSGVHVLALSTPERGAFLAGVLEPEARLGPGFPSLAELQAAALAARPSLRAHGQRIEAARHELRLSEREQRPGIGLMLGYGYRPGGMDMVSFGVDVELPVFRARKQSQAVFEAEHVLAAGELEHRQMLQDVRAEVASRYAALVRLREQIRLLMDGVIPQAEATVHGAESAYRTGRTEFLTLLEAQGALFRSEVELLRMLGDFGRELAELERAVGMDLLREEVR